jgi:CheY-like chemotaxis protein
VLAVSANDLPWFREGALEVGMDGYLTKPLDPELLRSELARVLDVAVPPSGDDAQAQTSSHSLRM